MLETTTGARFRERFPALGNSTYLVSHSMGAAPLGAREALDAYWRAWAQDGPEAWNEWLPQIGAIADNLGSLFGAPPGSVSLAPNVSSLQAGIASSLDFRTDRNEVVFEELQFPSVTYVWTEWERFGAHVVRVPSENGHTMSTDRLCAAITERTAVAVLSHAAYISGALLDIPALVRRCKTTGTLLVIDAYQTTGIYPYDVTALDIDITVGGSHKWLCGGPGCGYIYIKPALRDRFEPAITGWMAHEAPFAFEPAPIRYAQGPLRWSTGTPTVPGLLAARPGHDTIREVGVENVRAHNVRLTTRIIELALERKMTIPTPLDPAKRTGWIGLDFEGAERVASALISERTFIDYRAKCGIRVSPHFYTTDEEIDRFFDTLDAVRRRLTR